MSLDHEVRDFEYDLFVCTLGYERRARYVAQQSGIKGHKKVALGFPSQHVLSYHDNAKWYRGAEFDITELSDTDVAVWLRTALGTLTLARPNQIHLCIDISSMTRVRIASIVDVLRSRTPEIAIHCDFLYAIAKYSPAPEPLNANEHVGPVLPGFAGWTVEPERGPTGIVGLGYEQDKALGAVENLQATEVWAFEPVSHIREYTEAVRRANAALLEFVPPRRRFTYDVNRPFTLFSTLEPLTDSILRAYSPVLLPFGPKIFALVALLVASVHEDVAVWRVSAGINEPAVNRVADGPVTGLCVEF